MTPTRRSLLALPLLGALAACTDGTAPPTARDNARTPRPSLTVYKDASCGCCSGWVEHAEDHGFVVTTERPDNLATVWTTHDIPLDLQSCHLARTRGGDLFVGHVPARHVLEYLDDPPKGSRGLSVPAMPVGTPGMEQGDRFEPYQVMLITDGDPEIFATVSSRADQEV